MATRSKRMNVHAPAKGAGSDAVVWTSPDGVIWSRVPHDEAIFGGDGLQAMSSVTAGGPGLVAVGEDESGGDSDGGVWVVAKED